MDIVSELRSRYCGLERIMEERGLSAAVLVGNSAVGPAAYGAYRYFTDQRVFYHLQAMVARPGKQADICCESVQAAEGLRQRGFSLIHVCPEILRPVLQCLREQPIRRLGICPDMFPASWLDAVRDQWPAAELVDITEDIFALRCQRSEYELEVMRRGAQIADLGYEAVCDMARPGVRMADLHAYLDYTMRRAGAEEVFTLMSNGRFSLDHVGLPCIQPFSWPDDRVIRYGDCLGMEITPRFQGYWTQVVRTVCVGELNEDLAVAHRLQLEAINETAHILKPGLSLREMLAFMWDFSRKHGRFPKLPFGHILGLDLDEGGRTDLESPVKLRENTEVVLHPTMVTKEDMAFSIFWGDTFLVTAVGGRKVNKADTSLRVL